MRNIRTLLIIAGIFILICIVIIIAVLFQSFSSRTATDLSKEKEENLSVKYNHNLSILPSPPNGAKDVSIDSLINIKLPNPKTYLKINVSISPEIQHKISYTNSVIVIYHEQLTAGTTYTVLVSAENKDKTVEYGSFYFKTKGIAPNLVNTSGSEKIAEKSNQFNLKNHPDIFLSNNTPYETSTFSVKQDDENLSSIQFVVKTKGDKNLAKNDFISWAQSLGLSDEQINSIIINYQ